MRFNAVVLTKESSSHHYYSVVESCKLKLGWSRIFRWNQSNDILRYVCFHHIISFELSKPSKSDARDSSRHAQIEARGFAPTFRLFRGGRDEALGISAFSLSKRKATLLDEDLLACQQTKKLARAEQEKIKTERDSRAVPFPWPRVLAARRMWISTNARCIFRDRNCIWH